MASDIGWTRRQNIHRIQHPMIKTPNRSPTGPHHPNRSSRGQVDNKEGKKGRPDQDRIKITFYRPPYDSRRAHLHSPFCPLHAYRLASYPQPLTCSIAALMHQCHGSLAAPSLLARSISCTTSAEVIHLKGFRANHSAKYVCLSFFIVKVMKFPRNLSYTYVNIY